MRMNTYAPKPCIQAPFPVPTIFFFLLMFEALQHSSASATTHAVLLLTKHQELTAYTYINTPMVIVLVGHAARNYQQLELAYSNWSV
jgi:hypothetical protein